MHSLPPQILLARACVVILLSCGAFAAGFGVPLSTSGDLGVASSAFAHGVWVFDDLFFVVVGGLVGVGEAVAFFADAPQACGGYVPGVVRSPVGR
jgi:hypothetical protein